jgi:DnaJ-class molecular chaperone
MTAPAKANKERHPCNACDATGAVRDEKETYGARKCQVCNGKGYREVKIGGKVNGNN